MPGIASKSNTSKDMRYTLHIPKTRLSPHGFCLAWCFALEVAKQCLSRLGQSARHDTHIAHSKLAFRLFQFPPCLIFCFENRHTKPRAVPVYDFVWNTSHSCAAGCRGERPLGCCEARVGAGRTPVGTMLNTCTVQVDPTCRPPPPVLLPHVAGVDALCPDKASFPRHNKPPPAPWSRPRCSGTLSGCAAPLALLALLRVL